MQVKVSGRSDRLAATSAIRQQSAKSGIRPSQICMSAFPITPVRIYQLSLGREKKMTIQGGCLCGNVRYEVTGELYDAHHCHCSMCRRHHGAAFSTSAKLDPDDFKWLSGEGLVKIYESSPGVGWGFCSECGSSLVGTDNGEITMVTLGSIAGDPGARAESHIFVGSKAQWHDITDNVPQFKERS